MKKWNKPIQTKYIIIIGFLSLYVFCMFLITSLEKKDCDHQIYQDINSELKEIQKNVQYIDSVFDNDGKLTDDGIDYLNNILYDAIRSTDKNSMIQIGVLDSNGNLITKVHNHTLADSTYRSDGTHYHTIFFEKYLSPDELEQLISIYENSVNNYDTGYDLSYYYDEETDELILLYIHEYEMCEKPLGETPDGHKLALQTKVSLGTVFEWKNEEYLANKPNKREYYYGERSLSSIQLPYLFEGRKAWQSWQSNEYLQTFQEGIKNTELKSTMETHEKGSFGSFKDYFLCPLVDEHRDEDITFGFGGEHGIIYEDSYRIQLNLIANPWKMAMENLTKLYENSFLFVVICIAIVLYLTDKIYKKQAKLEETRRDFTNAIAHELKTPLSIVRGLAENIDIEESKDMRARFTRSIIGQTEVMNHLVEDMLFISKIDSDKMERKKESISIFKIIEEQVSKLEYPIEGKNLQIQYWKDEDFIITGDQSYIEKAIFNILENAVTYNRTDGRISIHVGKDNCRIENTAEPIPEEDLPHVCDMFFTGNKSRNFEENHKGLGLYLAKRIFEMYGIVIKIENSDIGVRVLLHKK